MKPTVLFFIVFPTVFGALILFLCAYVLLQGFGILSRCFSRDASSREVVEVDSVALPAPPVLIVDPNESLKIGFQLSE